MSVIWTNCPIITIHYQTFPNFMDIVRCSTLILSLALTFSFSSWFERYIFCPSGINCYIPNHVRPNSSFVHCNYTIWWKVCFHGQPLYMHNILDQLSRKVGRILLRYCCSSSHRKIVPFHEFCQPTIASDKSSFQLFIVAKFFIINRFSFKHDKLSRNT